jgi:crossover junction endodeoxyribonuclease RuvC
MPTFEIKGKRRVDVLELTEILHRIDAQPVVLEQVHSSPRMGVSSSYNFGRTYGQIEGVAAGLSLRLDYVTPQAWKTYHGLIGKPKDAARVKAIELFPQFKTELKRKKDCDRADALLIGNYFLRGKI